MNSSGTPLFVEVITSPESVSSGMAIDKVRKIAKKRKGIVLLEISLATEEGQELARQLDIQHAPAIAINGALAYIGVPETAELNKLLADAAHEEKEKTNYYI